MHLKPNFNTILVHSYRCNGQLGLIYLTVQLDIYNTLSDVLFKLPVNLDQHLVIPEGSLGPVAARIRNEYKDKFKDFLIYNQTDKTLESLLIITVDGVYIRSLCHKYVSYANVKTLTILNYLYG